jgi:hypothetical protein
MIKVDSNYYGRILIVIMVAALVGLYTTEPAITGFAVKEQKFDFSAFDIEVADEDKGLTCVDGSFYQECSSVTKGKFCLYGTLVDYCELCGCNGWEVCSERKCI